MKVVNRLDTRNNDGKSRQYNPSGRRWWLKLQFAFFSDKRVRALRRKHGDLALIIYQKIMLKSLENGSSMKFEGLEETFEEEIAVDIMEDNGDSLQLIRQIMDFLIHHDLMVLQDDGSYFFPQAAEMSGDETASAERMRRMRARKKDASQDKDNSDDDLSQNDDNSSHSNGMSHSDSSASKRYQIQSKKQNNRKDKAKTIATNRAIVLAEQESESETGETDSVSAEQHAASAAADAAAPRVAELFTVDQLREIVTKHKIDIASGGVFAFHTEMQASGWMLYKKPVAKAGIIKALRGWVKFHEEYHKEVPQTIAGQPRVKRPSGEDVDDDTEAEIWEIAREYISQRRFDENKGGHRSQIGKYCPRSAFTPEQLEYMMEWGIYPKSERLVEVDEYFEDEE